MAARAAAAAAAAAAVSAMAVADTAADTAVAVAVAVAAEASGERPEATAQAAAEAVQCSRGERSRARDAAFASHLAPPLIAPLALAHPPDAPDAVATAWCMWTSRAAGSTITAVARARPRCRGSWGRRGALARRATCRVATRPCILTRPVGACTTSVPRLTPMRPSRTGLWSRPTKLVKAIVSRRHIVPSQGAPRLATVSSLLTADAPLCLEPLTLSRTTPSSRRDHGTAARLLRQDPCVEGQGAGSAPVVGRFDGGG